MYTRFHLYLKIQKLKFIYLILQENKKPFRKWWHNHYQSSLSIELTKYRYSYNCEYPVNASIEMIFQKFTMIEHSRQLDTATRPFANLNP